MSQEEQSSIIRAEIRNTFIKNKFALYSEMQHLNMLLKLDNLSGLLKLDGLPIYLNFPTLAMHPIIGTYVHRDLWKTPHLS